MPPKAASRVHVCLLLHFAAVVLVALCLILFRLVLSAYGLRSVCVYVYLENLVCAAGSVRRVLRGRRRQHREGEQLPHQQRPQLEEEQIPPDLRSRGS